MFEKEYCKSMRSNLQQMSLVVNKDQSLENHKASEILNIWLQKVTQGRKRAQLLRPWGKKTLTA